MNITSKALRSNTYLQEITLPPNTSHTWLYFPAIRHHPLPLPYSNGLAKLTWLAGQTKINVPLYIGEKVKVKVSHTRYRAFGPELIPVYSDFLSQFLGGRLLLLSTRPAVTFPAKEHHRPLTSTKLHCLVTECAVEKWRQASKWPVYLECLWQN